MQRRHFLASGVATMTGMMVPSVLRAQEQPGPPTPGVVQATTAPPAPAPDVSMLVSPDARGKSLLVVNKQALTVAFHDAVTGERQAMFSLPSRPHEVLVARDGRTAYVSIYGDGIDLLPGSWSEFGEKFPVRFGVRRTRESVDEDVEV